MTPLQFFDGKITGFGVVLGITGKVQRRFEVEMRGEWSDEHRALHLDETYAYAGGGGAQRRWAIQADDEGVTVGYDAVEMARMRGWPRGQNFRLVFDRQHRRTDRWIDPPQTVDLVEISPTEYFMYGRVHLFGLTIATLHTSLRREPDV
jgi:hypothetical protein